MHGKAYQVNEALPFTPFRFLSTGLDGGIVLVLVVEVSRRAEVHFTHECQCSGGLLVKLGCSQASKVDRREKQQRYAGDARWMCFAAR